MKRGAIHLDWMISMSIFLVFLLLILVYFKPGSEPAYQKRGKKWGGEPYLEHKHYCYENKKYYVTLDDL